jgi:hypothetical protein
MNAPKVFINYDWQEHSERVLHFAWALLNTGIDVELDLYDAKGKSKRPASF